MRSASAAFFGVINPRPELSPSMFGRSNLRAAKWQMRQPLLKVTRIFICDVTQPVVLEKLARIRCNVRSEINMSRMLSFQV